MDTPKILIIDDKAHNRQTIGGTLLREGFQVLCASNGTDGFETSCREMPDMILLDVVMPGESGFEICTRLKSEPRTAGIPVIFLSALDDVRAKVTGLTIGAVDYISKPVCDEELLARVRTHLRIRQLNAAAVQEHRLRLERLQSAQNALLVNPASLPDACFAVDYRPLEEGGGDFYDVVPVDSDIFGYFVADVSGHGIDAAFVTSAIKALLRERTGPLFSPEDAMHGIDAVIRSVFAADQYLTACYARLNLRAMKLSVVSAGHPPLILAPRNGIPTAVQGDGDPLGVFSGTVLQRRDLAVSRGDRFFLYTDGLIELTAAGHRRAGLERLIDACSRRRAMPIGEAVAGIVSDLHPNAARRQDDLLLLGVDVRSPTVQTTAERPASRSRELEELTLFGA